MSENFNLRSKAYWQQMGWALLTGLFSAIAAFVFIALMNVGSDFIWPDTTDWTPFSGSWFMVVVMTLAGLVVGLIHHFTDAAELDVFEALDEGDMDPKPVPASVLASLVSLIGGFALGPEVPSGMLGAGLGGWIARRRNMNAENTRVNVIGGVSAAYAGLFSSPFAILVLLLESKHRQTITYYGTLLIAAMAAAVGFGLFYFLGGEAFSSLLGLISPPAYDLRLWHLGVGILLGIVALPVAVLLPVLLKILGRLVAPLNGKPIIRGILGGLLLGLLAYALPITIGLGTTEMGIVTQQAAQMGVGLLLVFAVAKILALSGAISFGFIGGPIFPLLFVGSTVGSAILLLFPQLPEGLVLGCMIVAGPAAIVPIPLALGVIGALIVGLPPTNILPIFLAALVAFSITHGMGLGNGKKKAQAEG